LLESDVDEQTDRGLKGESGGVGRLAHGRSWIQGSRERRGLRPEQQIQRSEQRKQGQRSNRERGQIHDPGNLTDSSADMSWLRHGLLAASSEAV
jgi:hypothetical protein